MAKPSSDEPYAVMSARTGLWEPWWVTARATRPAARKGSSNSETSYPANAGYGSRPSVSYSRPTFMSSRDFEFETAIWDCRFSEWMKSLLSQSRHRVKGTFDGLFPFAIHWIGDRIPVSADHILGQFLRNSWNNRGPLYVVSMPPGGWQ